PSLRDLLLAIQFDDQLLIHRQLNFITLGQRIDAALVVVAINVEPRRLVLVARKVLRYFQDRQLAAAFADCDLFSDAHLIRRNVHLASVNGNVSVTHQLARLAAAEPETQAIYNVVEAALEVLQEQFTGHALRARRLFEVISELAFLGEVNALSFLLLAKLQAVTHDFSFAVFTVLPRRKVALLDRTLIAKTFCAFEKKLHPFTTAQAAYCIFVTCQVFFSPSFLSRSFAPLRISTGLRDWLPFFPVVAEA